MRNPILGVLLFASLAAVGCSAPTEDAGTNTGTDDVTGSKLTSALERTLASPEAVPTGTPIGQTIDSIVAQKSAGLKAGTPRETKNEHSTCTSTSWADANGKGVLSRRKCVADAGYSSSDIVWFGKIVYADHGDDNGAIDGKVDSYRDETDALYEVSDDNRDGRVDRIIEAASRVQGLSVATFAPNCKVTNDGAIANRIREDKNFDGRFELESITAKTPEMFLCTGEAQ